MAKHQTATEGPWPSLTTGHLFNCKAVSHSEGPQVTAPPQEPSRSPECHILAAI